MFLRTPRDILTSGSNPLGSARIRISLPKRTNLRMAKSNAMSSPFLNDIKDYHTK